MTDTATFDAELAGFLDATVERVRSRYWKLEHPFAVRLLAGALTPQEVAVWSGQYFQLTAHVADCIGYLIVNAPDLHVKRELVHNLAQEFGDGYGNLAHRDLFADFAASAGVDRATVTGSPLLPGTRGLIAIARQLSQRSFLSGVVAIPVVGEMFGPESSRRYLEAFRDHYGATDLRYWETHIEADAEHGATGRRTLERLATTADARAAIVDAVEWALDGFWGLYDSVMLYGRDAGRAASA